MNLIVDIGNTVTKLALCEGMVLGKTFRYQGENKLDFILDIARKNLPEAIAISSPRAISDRGISELKKVCERLVILDPNHRQVALEASIPDYVMPDCTASIIAARKLFGGKACTVFDFGTIITSSFLSSSGEYEGGTISPGCTTRFRSIKRYAGNLPLLSETEENKVIGDSLNSAIRSGVVSGIMFEIDGYISTHPDNIVVFTGGDANYFAKRTKNSIFVVCNLVLMGLALIAEQE